MHATAYGALRTTVQYALGTLLLPVRPPFPPPRALPKAPTMLQPHQAILAGRDEARAKHLRVPAPVPGLRGKQVLLLGDQQAAAPCEDEQQARVQRANHALLAC